MNTKVFIQKDGSIQLSRIQRNALQKDAGKMADIVIDRRANAKKIGFFEGPITQYFFYQHEKGVFDNFREAREALKLELNPKYIKNVKGKSVITAGSLEKVYESNRATTVLLEKAQDFFMQNGYIFPDSEDYKKWRDSAPGPDEVYPPLQKLADKWGGVELSTGRG